MEQDASEPSSSRDAESSPSETVSSRDETEELIELPANILAYVPGIAGVTSSSTVLSDILTDVRGGDRGVCLPRPPLQNDRSARRRPFPRCGRWRGGGGGPVFGPRPSWRGRPPLRPFFGRRAGPPRFNPRGGNDAPFFGWRQPFYRGRAHHFYATPYIDRDSPYQGRRRPALLPLPFLDERAPHDTDSVTTTTTVLPSRSRKCAAAGPTTASVVQRQGATKDDSGAASASRKTASLTEGSATSTALAAATTASSGIAVSAAAATERSSVTARDDGARGQQTLSDWIRCVESVFNDAPVLTPTPEDSENAEREPSRDPPTPAEMDDMDDLCGNAEHQDPAATGEGAADADFELGLTPASALTTAPVNLVSESVSTPATCAARNATDNASVTLDCADSTPAPHNDSGEPENEWSCVRSPSPHRSSVPGQASNDRPLTGYTASAVSGSHDAPVSSTENDTVRDSVPNHPCSSESAAAPPKGSGKSGNEWSQVCPPSADQSVLGQVSSDCPAVQKDDQCQGVAEEGDNRVSLEMGCNEGSPDSQRPVVDDDIDLVLIASESGGVDDDDVYVVCESRAFFSIQK